MGVIGTPRYAEPQSLVSPLEGDVERLPLRPHSTLTEEKKTVKQADDWVNYGTEIHLETLKYDNTLNNTAHL